MHTLYITDNGILLKKRSDRILVKKDRKVLEEIPTLELKRILIFGNNQVSTQLMNHLARKGIEVGFLSAYGKFKYRLVPETSKNIYLRMAQHERYRDMAFRIRFSQTVTEAKLKNQRSLLVRYQRNRPDVDLSSASEALKKCCSQVNAKQSINEIMGTEGFGAKNYFNAYGKLLLGGFEFRKREYYPPPDPVNALLSFGYMLLFNELNSLLEASGFDVYLGFLHSVKYGRASLASDMIEELRSPVIDRLVLYLINQGAVKPSQFSHKENRCLRMNDNALKNYLQNYERFMTATFVDVKTRDRKNYRQVIRENIRRLENVLLNNIDYTPYVFYS